MNIKIEILSTGDEVCLGAIVDSNSAYIAQELLLLGIRVSRHTCVGDNLDELVSVFKEISIRSDVAIVTGGLGPTEDDLSREAAAKTLGVNLILNQDALLSVENFFKSLNRKVNSIENKQMTLPEGAKCIPNPYGTAPGFIFKIKKCIFFFLPGVPSEMRAMLSDYVLPYIRKNIWNDEKIFKVKTLSVFGLPESDLNDKISDLEKSISGLKIGLRAMFPDIQIKLYAHGNNEAELTEIINKAIKEVSIRIGKYIFSYEGETMEEVVGRLLSVRGKTVAVAESCTGGLISSLLTNVSGSSNYFNLSVVAYSNNAKVDLIGVSSDTLELFGAVHEETAKEMAEGVKKISGADYGLSATGIAGPLGGSLDKPVGTVCIGISSYDMVSGYRFTFSFNDRLKHKKIFAITALELLRRKLLDEIKK
ncbi:MAG: competence/damage-inducible protein A [Desulfobacterales bacterium]|nr:competence/damage-inducible protein A [Desulfobacterales bacterium]